MVRSLRLIQAASRQAAQRPGLIWIAGRAETRAGERPPFATTHEAERAWQMDRSDPCFWRCMGAATGAPRLVKRRTVLSGAAGWALLASAGPGFGQAPAANDSTMKRNGTMDINRNGSRPSGKGPEAWFTGTVRVDPLFQVGDPTRLSCGQVTFEPGGRTMWHTHPSARRLL